MTPRDPDKGNFDDTEFPGDNPDVPGHPDQPHSEESDPRHSDRKLRGGNAKDEGDYDDKDQ